MANTVLEKMLKIKQVKINVNRCYSLTINKKILEESDIKDGDWIRLIPSKNHILIKKVDIKKLLGKI